MHNSHLLVTKKPYAAWKMMLAILTITFIWQIITTRAYADPLPNLVPVQEIATPTVASPPISSREEVIKKEYANVSFLSVVETGKRLHYSEKDLFCLAKNIYHEAGAEPIKGKYAVAQVTLNRTQNRMFEGSVCEVVFAPHQFSWANSRTLRWATPAGPNWQESKRIALDVLENGKRIKGMERALYFHSIHINPRWRNVGRLTRIGAHIFYARNG
jgi:spore germination cell wall hydrolase CwlJ-like protein